MSATDEKAPVKTAITFPASMTLDAFCRELSTTDSRVELLAGFHRQMTLDKQVSGSREGFDALFTAYATKPIG